MKKNTAETLLKLSGNALAVKTCEGNVKSAQNDLHRAFGIVESAKQESPRHNFQVDINAWTTSSKPSNEM
jgi:hypothetical protein